MTKIEYDVTDAANRKLNLSYLVLPTVYSNYDSDSYGNLWFHDTGTLNNYLSLYLVEVQDMNNPSTYNPILALDQGLWVEKDVQTYGALFSSTDPGKPAGGGAINLGHGYTGTLAPPSINLVDSGLINLILDSEVFGIADSYWSGYGGNKNNITSGFLSPDKVNYTAQKIDTSVAGGCTGCYQSVSPSLSAGQSYTVSVWLKGASGGESLKIGLNDSYESSSITLQTSWVRYSFTATPTVGHTDRGMQFRCLTANAVYYVWGAQLQTGSNLTSYAKTTTGASSPFDTLFLYKADGTSANLDLGNLTVHGSLTVSQISSNLIFSGSNYSIQLPAGGWIQWGSPSAKLAMVNANRAFSGNVGLATQSGLGVLGIHLTSGLQVDAIDSVQGGGIYFYDNVNLGGTINSLNFAVQGGVWNNIYNNLSYGILINYNTGHSWGDVFQIFNGGTTMLFHVDASGTMYAAGNFSIGGYMTSSLIPSTLTPTLGSGTYPWGGFVGKNVYDQDLSAGSNHTVYATASGLLTNSASSMRYKTNIQTITDADWIYSLRPVTFDWKNDEQAKTDGPQIGLIAEEVASLSMMLAWNNTAGQVEGVHYEKLAVPMLVELQKLRKEVDALKSKLVAA